MKDETYDFPLLFNFFKGCTLGELEVYDSYSCNLFIVLCNECLMFEFINIIVRAVSLKIISSMIFNSKVNILYFIYGSTYFQSHCVLYSYNSIL